MASEMVCGCAAKRGQGIVFCSLHQKAQEMATALVQLRGYYAQTMPESPFIGLIDAALPKR